MIHHLTIRVRDIHQAKAFYTAALAPLGYRVLGDYGEFVGLGVHAPDLWLAQYAELTPMHVAFAADSEGLVQAFHQAALAAGGKDNGAPGPRPQYGPAYYGAFVLDADGNNIEATLLPPPPTAKAARATKPARKKSQGKAKKVKAAPRGAAPKKAKAKTAPKRRR